MYALQLGCLWIFTSIEEVFMLQQCYLKQHSFCSLNEALRFFGYIKGLGIIVHGPQGCGSTTANEIMTNQGYYRTLETVILYSTFDDRNFIYGCEEQLLNDIDQFIQLYDLKDIVVLQTCSPVITGTGYEYIKKNVSARHADINLMVIRSEGMNHRFHYDFYQRMIKEFLALILPVEDSADKKYDLNIINAFDTQKCDYKALYRLLIPMGIKVRFLPYDASLSALKDIRSAKVTLALCQTTNKDILKYLEKSGLDVLFVDAPRGFLYTSIWLRSIMEALGISDSEKKIGEEEKRYKERLNQLRHSLRGRRVILTAGKGHLLQWAQMCVELGMTVVATGCMHTAFDKKEQLNALTGVQCQDDVQWSQVDAWIEQYRPDVYLVKHAVPYELTCKRVEVVRLSPQSKTSYYGYKGLLDLGDGIVQQLACDDSQIIQSVKHYSSEYRNAKGE